MNDLEKNQSDAIVRSSEFGTQQPQLFPAGQFAAQLLARLHTAAAKLTLETTKHASSRGSAQQNTVGKATLREALHEHLATINRIAQALSFEMPGLKNKFRMPRGDDNDLLTGARAFAADALPLKSDFIRYGLPEDFIEDLNDDIAAFEQATAARNQSMGQQAASHAAQDEALADGLQALRQLDTYLQTVLRDDPAMLAAWNRASHIERVPHRRKSPQTSPPPPAPPAQTSSEPSEPTTE
jgi:hypothetical protein